MRVPIGHEALTNDPRKLVALLRISTFHEAFTDQQRKIGEAGGHQCIFRGALQRARPERGRQIEDRFDGLGQEWKTHTDLR